jgi:hypothetical protein
MAHDVEKEDNENSEKNIEKIPKSIEVILHKKSKKSLELKIPPENSEMKDFLVLQ